MLFVSLFVCLFVCSLNKWSKKCFVLTRNDKSTTLVTRVGSFLFSHFAPPRSCAVLTKHFNLTQVCIWRLFSNIERGNGGAGTYSIGITVMSSCISIFAIFQHNLSTVVGSLRQNNDEYVKSELINMTRAWKKEKSEPWQESNPWPSEHRAGVRSLSCQSDGFDSCRGLRFFFVLRSCLVDHFTFHISVTELKI